MPNRIIKESICTSDDIASLSWFEQVVFMRLIVTADDYGRLDARPSIVKGKMFPLDNVTIKQISDALAKLSTAGMVLLYEISGRPYLQLTAWNKHQTPRAKESKYPAPDEGLQADENICAQMNADAPVFVFDNRYSNSINDSRIDSTEPDTDSLPVITLSLNDKSEHAISNKDISGWKELYPAVDIMQELRNMKGWLDSNPSKRKTKSGIGRFINSWLAKEQNSGGSQVRKQSNKIYNAGRQYKTAADTDREPSTENAQSIEYLQKVQQLIRNSNSVNVEGLSQ